VITDGPDAVNLAETDAALLTNGTLTVSDVDTTDVVTASINGLVVTGTSDRGDPLAPDDTALLAMFSINPVDPATILDGTQNTATLNWNFNSGVEVFDYLATGETLVLTYTVQATDDDGTTPLNDTETVTITITGSNDAPVIAIGDVTGDITEGATLTDNGSLTFTDLDTSDTPAGSITATSITTSVTGGLSGTQQTNIQNAFTISTAGSNNGTVTWDYNITEGELDFLAAGETVTAVFTITLDDANGGTPTQDVTINITGSNDAPVITGGPDTAGLAETDAALLTSGTLIVSDVDTTDVVTASIDSLVVSGTSDRGDPLAPDDTALLAMFSINPVDPATILDATQNTATLNWDFDSGTEFFDYLANGETLILTYTVQAIDDDGTTPLNDTETVTITITGSNDAPVIAIGDVTGDITEGATLTDNGSFTFTDLDTTDTPTASITGTSVSTSVVGGLSAAEQTAIENAFGISAAVGNDNNGTINWDYNITEGELDFLAAGETVTAVFTITLDDANGGTPTQPITINITGSNDAPVITGGPDAVGLAETDAALTTNGTLTVSDVDTTDVVTASVSGLVVTGTSDRGDAAAPTDMELLAMLTVSPTTILNASQNSATLTWDFDSGSEFFDYLANGETLVLTYTVQATDAALNDSETVTITITGSNDAPVITDGPDAALPSPAATMHR